MGITNNLKSRLILKLPNKGNFEEKEIKSKWENKLDEKNRKKKLREDA